MSLTSYIHIGICSKESLNLVSLGNDITINDIENLMQNYTQLQSDIDSLNQQKDALVEQNTQYYNDLINANKIIEELNSGLNCEICNLKSQLDSTPVLNYRNLALSIDVDDIPINTNNSMVTIDGRDYLSREILESIVPDEKSITIKDDTIFVGQVVADRTNLFDFRPMDQNNIYMIDAITDSYGNNYSHVLYTHTSRSGSKFIIYPLDRKFSLMKITVAIRDNADLNSTGILTIKADDNIVYTSNSLYKKMETFTEKDIPINNCNLLTIEYAPSSFHIDCIISNAEVYN